MAAQLNDYLAKFSLLEPMQSAYQEFHSTETALTCVLSDILMSLDQRKSVFLVLLDLSEAFDMVDHGLLSNCLSSRLGIKGIPLEWIRSYLTIRTQFVFVGDFKSESLNLARGSPPGVCSRSDFLYYLHPSPGVYHSSA